MFLMSWPTEKTLVLDFAICGTVAVSLQRCTLMRYNNPFNGTYPDGKSSFCSRLLRPGVKLFFRLLTVLLFAQNDVLDRELLWRDVT